ncbi:MAG: hypothetical protein ABII71_02620 [Candidatus Micrarchaeota archaeon]
MDIATEPSIGQAMTFELSKKKPFHGWFWYKEGYAPEIVDYALQKEGILGDSLVVDPFCGVGTTLLAAKASGLQSFGVDASQLAVFVSKTKTDDYSTEEIEGAKGFLANIFKERHEARIKWDFELFSSRAAFPKRNYNDMLYLREMIEKEEGRVRNLLLLALLSIIPLVSIIVKDGGVLKIEKKKRALPVKDAFKRRLKRMLSDLENPVKGPTPEIVLGDARALQLQDGCADIIVTSPPYLNNIDYSKVYGLELSLLELSKTEAEHTRARSVRSFIGRQMDVDEMPPEVGEEGFRIPIIGTYFRDMEGTMREMHRVLKPGKAAYVIVSNSVIHQTHVLVDEVLAEIGERIGFSENRIIVGAERIADVKPHKVKTRESIVVLRK